MPININTKELLEILDSTPNSHNIMLSGRHGIGKSRIVSDYYLSKGITVVTLFLGQMSDPGDLIGLPEKDTATGTTTFLPPSWFPLDNTPVVLFLDELNRARPEILQTVMDLCLNRTLAGRCLPKGSRVVAAVNDGEEYLLTELDPALVSRFNIYNFRPTPGEWLVWAEKAGIDSHVTQFIENNPMMLDGHGDTLSGISCLEKTPDRRAWERVSDIMKGAPAFNSTTKKHVAGIIGAKAASSFFESFSQNKIIPAELILANFSKQKKTLEGYQPHDIAIVNDAIYRCIENGKEGDKCSENLIAYINWLIDSGRRESMAHFCSVFEGATYSKANLYMMSKVPKCFSMITEFIKSM